MADHAGFLVNGEMTFSEPVEKLLGRFRQVTAVFEQVPDSLPAETHWGSVTSSGKELRFVDQQFEEADCRFCLEKRGQLANLEARPLSLREIFIEVTRMERRREEVSV